MSYQCQVGSNDDVTRNWLQKSTVQVGTKVKPRAISSQEVSSKNGQFWRHVKVFVLVMKALP